jgi:arsenic resistance protein ArsH
MEELIKFTLLLRDRSAYLMDRYSERVESVEEVAKAGESAFDLRRVAGANGTKAAQP